MSLIEKLADLVGFHRSYVDCFGTLVKANEQARHNLLQAMGYDLSSDETIQAAIIELEQQAWCKLLPSCVIAKAEESNHPVALNLPSSTYVFKWQVITEDGQVLNKVIELSHLKQQASKTIHGVSYQRFVVELPKLPLGYHQLTVYADDKSDSCTLICAPKTCYLPQEASAKKMWGYAAQLYSLKSETNWGMGDFGDLLTLIEQSAQQHASIIGLNPLHPLFYSNPAHRSPYSPTSRCFLNTLYINIEQIPNYRSCDEAQKRINAADFKTRIEQAKHAELIDYPLVAQLKFEIIELLYQDFINYHTSGELANEFNQFKVAGGEDLLKLATYETLYEHFRKKDFHAYGWTAWPTNYQDPTSTEVEEFQQQHTNRIDYFCFIQWLAHRQLSHAASLTKALEMPVGLYLDLAVGCDGSGVDVWSDREVFVAGASVGAPPDAMNVMGQDWGLTPINPVALQQQGYMPLAKALRSNMQYAGALRIDHILGLMRQYWVAPGMPADQGVYISFPFDDILRVIALESRRNNCVVIGEDLGTVPDGFGEIMAAAGLLSYKVMYFEKWDSGFFKRPELYPAQSMVTVSTHDLPTLTSWWTGRDLNWRRTLNLYPTDEMAQAEQNARIKERELLVAALQDMQVLTSQDDLLQEPPHMSRALTIATQKFLAQANSHILLIPLEDALEVAEQVNIPGTVDEHPNWQQKLPVNIELFNKIDSVKELVTAMQQMRPRND